MFCKKCTTGMRERVELHQDKHKTYTNNKRQQIPKFTPGDKVWVRSLHGPDFSDQAWPGLHG